MNKNVPVRKAIRIDRLVYTLAQIGIVVMYLIGSKVWNYRIWGASGTFFWWVFLVLSIFVPMFLAVGSGGTPGLTFLGLAAMVSAELSDRLRPYNIPWWVFVLLWLILGFGSVLLWSWYRPLDGEGGRKNTLLGSAGFASTIGKHGEGKQTLFTLGSFDNTPFYQGGHMLTCAPSGAGKGIGAVIPNLLQYSGSIFCVDIKGENYSVTSRFRRENNQFVYLVDPFGVTGDETMGFNIFDWFISHPDDIVGDSESFADSLIVAGSDSDSFWTDSARDLIRGILLYISTYENIEDRNIGELRRILTLSKDDFVSVMEKIQTCSVRVAQRMANNILAMADTTRSSVLTTAVTQTSFLDDERVEYVMSKSTVPLDDFKTDGMSIYLVLPPDRLAGNYRLIRILISLLIMSVTRSKKKPVAPALFLFDEFAQLGKMKIIEDTLSLIRGYGASYWFIIQDLSQLKAVYQKWQTFLANTSKQFFQTADHDTAKYISEMLGKETIDYKTTGSSSSTSESTKSESASYSQSTSQHIQTKDVLSPNEVMEQDPETVIVFIRSEPPYKLKRLNYLTDPNYFGLFDDNPYH